jgi:hypothetical protein
MMTTYEMLAHKLKNLKDAEDRCNERGRLTMAFVWHQKAAQLANQMLEMSVEDAERLVVL